MESNSIYNDWIKPNLPQTKKEYIIFIIIILVVVTIGLFAFNQYLGIQYKARIVQDPCSLCKEFRSNPYGVTIDNFSNITLINPNLQIEVG